MNNLFYSIALLSAAEEEEDMWISDAGFFDSYTNIVAIVLIVVGLAIIYFGVKLLKGYTFHPDETVVVEKDEGFVTINADIAERRQTEIPNYSAAAHGKSNDLFKEMRIVYTVDGVEYTEWVSDYGEDMYKDSVPIKYDPDDPKDFYVLEGDGDFQGIPDENGDLDGNEDDEDETDVQKNGIGVVVIIVGVLIMAVGIGILIDYFGR